MKILIGLIEHLGDIVACEPIARYLKTEHKDASISWAVSKPYRELIDSNPYIDETVIIDCLTGWINYKKASKLKYDYIFDLHVNYRICQQCNIPLFKTTGNTFVNGYEWFDYGSLLEAFSVGAGLPRLSEQPRVYLSQKHIDLVNKLKLGNEYVVINRSSNDKNKDWQDKKWNYIIKKIINDFGLSVIEVGTGVNGKIAKDLFYNKSYINLKNKTSILDCAEVIRRSCLFIGIDSGPAHLANALNIKGVVLLGKYLYFKRYNPFCGGYGEDGKNVEIVRNENGPVSEISVENVIDVIKKAILDNDGQDNSSIPRVKGDFQETRNIKIKDPDSRLTLKEEECYPKLLAFYLPQFHPIPENDAAWGNGFTEWTNVRKAKPLYEGHHQPRIPGELGYYDLRDVSVLEKQVQLALNYNISGFCFYYYYFQGKRLLYTPIENFIKSKIKFPFCFIWANENWTRRWDGGDKEIIMAQLHSPEDNIRFIKGLFHVFRNENYIKVNNKPLLFVYKTHLIPNIKQASEQWREEAERAGFDGLYLVRVDDFFGFQEMHPREIGFDASYEIPSNIILRTMENNKVNLLNFHSKFNGKLIDYDEFAAFHMGRSFPKYKKFKTVMLPWDNTARYGDRALIIDGDNQIESYKKWLLTAYLDTYRRYEGDERLLFVHSWNEWAEGTYLEPDVKNGRKYLEATSETIVNAKESIKLLNTIGDNKELKIDGISTINEYIKNAEEIIFMLSYYEGKKIQSENNYFKRIIYNFLKSIYKVLKEIPIVGIGVKKLKPVVIEF
jgi:ADP-heptose:LPS heptosyltransferase